MPMLIRTPEDIFRAEGKDVYCLHFNQDDASQVEKTRNEMHDWLSQHLPGTHTELMGPSENSGFVMGGPVALRVDFSEQGLADFCARWENPETGESMDPRFQCYLMSYADWLAEYGHFVPTLDKPEHVGPAVWIDTPLGVLTHVLPPEQAAQASAHPAHFMDLWMHAVKLWPALQPLDVHTLVHGRVLPWAQGPSAWWVEYADDFEQPLQDARKREILAWLGLPADTRMVHEFD